MFGADGVAAVAFDLADGFVERHVVTSVDVRCDEGARGRVRRRGIPVAADSCRGGRGRRRYSRAVPAPYDYYQRTGGGPVLRTSVVLFLDVLGTATPRTDAEAQAHLELTIAALEQARDWGDSDPDDTTAVVSWFSDNLGYALPYDGEREALSEVIGSVQEHQCAFANHGLVGRGAITLGLFYAEVNVLQGPALNEAVALEKATKMPRVALDDAAVAAVKDEMSRFWGDGPNAEARHMLAVDDDTTFVNYLDLLQWDEEETPLSLRFLAKHKALIENELRASAGNQDVHDKYCWLAGYHDWFLSDFAEPLAEQARELVIGHRPAYPSAFRPFGHDVPTPPDPLG